MVAALKERAERAEHFDRVWSDLQPGADLFELRGAFEERDFAAALAQRARGREPADTGADDRDPGESLCGLRRHWRSRAAAG